MKSDYSEKEFEMIRILYPSWAALHESDEYKTPNPTKILEIIASQCFIENRTGKAVDSLRRCLGALQNCNPYRKTPEYDALIDL